MHVPPELKLSLLSHVCNENDVFSVPHKSSEIDSKTVFRTLQKIKWKVYLSVFQNLECEPVTVESIKNFYSSSSGM